jgi:hypothetical protein
MLWDDVEIGDSLQVDSLAGVGDRTIGVDSAGKLKVLAVTVGDTTYLRLDGTNSPMTGQLLIEPTTPGDDGIYVQTAGDAYPADFEQYTTSTDITSNALFLYRETNGAGNITASLLEAWQAETGAGTITGDWIKLVDSGTPVFNITKNGDAFTRGSLLITEAPTDGGVYGRQLGGWVNIASGVTASGGSITVVNDNTATTYNNTDTIHFSGGGFSTSNLGAGDIRITFDVLSVADPYGLHHRLSGSHADDDEFSSNTIANWTGVTPTGVSGTWAIENHCLGVQFTGSTGTPALCKLKALTIADGEWLETCMRSITTANNYTMVGLIMTNGTSTGSSAMALTTYQSSVAGEITIRVDTGTIASLTSTALSQTVKSDTKSGAFRLRLKRVSSTAYKWYVAPESGTPFYDWGLSTVNPGFTPTHGGLWVSTWGSSHNALASFDYYRHMS